MANDDSGFIATENTALSIPASALLANDTDLKWLPLSITGVSNATNGTVSYDPNTQTVSFVPTDRLHRAGFLHLFDHRRPGRHSIGKCLRYWSTTPRRKPVQPDLDAEHCDSKRPQFGRARRQVPGLRERSDHRDPFLQGPAEHGHACGGSVERHGHAARHRHLHQRNGKRLAAGQLLQSGDDHRGDDLCRFLPHERRLFCRSQSTLPPRITSGPLTAPANAGVFAYGSSSLFPTNSFNSSSYGVDVVFKASAIQPPVANNDSGFIATENTALSIPASALLANDTDPNGLPLSITGVSNPSNGTVSYDPNTQTVSFVPTTGYSGTASFSYSITDGQSTSTASANVALFVNDPSAASLFSLTSAPSIVSVNDPNSIELGVEFQASANGQITGLRFYKGPQNTGAHVADLWSATGTLLATATFTNETASGWQQVNFSNPVAITRGDDLCRFVPHERRLFCRSQSLCHSANEWPANGSGRRWRIRVWKLQPISHQQCFNQLRG